MTQDEILKHYGVKGMQWGKRKGQLSATLSKSREKIKASVKKNINDPTKVKKYAKNGVKIYAGVVVTTIVGTVTLGAAATAGAIAVGKSIMN